MASLLEIFRDLKITIGKNPKRNYIYHFNCLNNCLDFIANFYICNSRDEFEIHLFENRHLLKQVVNLFNINRYLFHKLKKIGYQEITTIKKKKTKDPKSRNFKVLDVVIKCIHMEKIDAHLLLQLASVFSFVVTRSSYNVEEIQKIIAKHFIHFFLDILEHQSDLDFVNNFVFVLHKFDLYKTRCVMSFYEYAFDFIFTSKLLHYTINYILESIKISLETAAKPDIVPDFKNLYKKSVINCIILIELFAQAFVSGKMGLEKLFVECIFSTMDLLNLYCHFFDAHFSKKRYGSLVSNILFQSHPIIFTIMLDSYNARCVDLLKNLFNPRIVEFYHSFELKIDGRKCFIKDLERLYSKSNVFRNKVHSFSGKLLQSC